MSIGERLREERLRLGLSQGQFAELAGASKRAQLKWEKEDSYPTVPAMAAWEQAGADVLYIISGKRADERREEARRTVSDDLSEVRRLMLDPSQLEEAPKAAHANKLRAILNFDTPFMTDEMIAEARRLLAATEDADKLTAFRREAYADERGRRDRFREQLNDWLEGSPYVPGEGVAHLLLTLGIDYAVPAKLLAIIVDEFRTDYERQRRSDPSLETVR